MKTIHINMSPLTSTQVIVTVHGEESTSSPIPLEFLLKRTSEAALANAIIDTAVEYNAGTVVVSPSGRGSELAEIVEELRRERFHLDGGPVVIKDPTFMLSVEEQLKPKPREIQHIDNGWMVLEKTASTSQDSEQESEDWVEIARFATREQLDRATEFHDSAYARIHASELELWKRGE